MKRKDFLKSLESKSVSELKTEARTLSEEQMKMSFRRVSSTLKETHLICENRRDRARVLTELTKRTNAAA